MSELSDGKFHPVLDDPTLPGTREDVSRRIDDRPADLCGRGLSMDRQGAGGPEQEETHEPEQATTHVGRILLVLLV